MTDYHAKQITGSRCGPYNCAAASGAMAVAFAGGPRISADQFRVASGISCTPGVDSSSGGLRSVDVYRVARSFGVTVNYGGANGTIVDWPAWALEGRLREGEGCIVLGDCKDAPTNPSYNVIYHSSFVHGFRVYNGVEQTHWHDPRNTGATWQSVSGVIRYWQGMDHGRRFAGFVEPAQVSAAPDTSTAPPGGTEVGLRTQNARAISPVTLEVTATYPVAAIVVHNFQRIPLSRGTRKRAVCKVWVPVQTGIGSGGQGDAYILADENLASPDPIAVVFARDVRVV